MFIAGLANLSIIGLGPSFTLLSIEARFSSILIIWMSVVVILSKNDSNLRGSLCYFIAELNNSVCEGALSAAFSNSVTTTMHGVIYRPYGIFYLGYSSLYKNARAN